MELFVAVHVTPFVSQHELVSLLGKVTENIFYDMLSKKIILLCGLDVNLNKFNVGEF